MKFSLKPLAKLIFSLLAYLLVGIAVGFFIRYWRGVELAPVICGSGAVVYRIIQVFILKKEPFHTGQ